MSSLSERGFCVYTTYGAMKLHFSRGSYDYIKYHGKTKTCNVRSYKKSKISWVFEKMSKSLRSADIVPFLSANMSISIPGWPGDLLNDKCFNRLSAFGARRTNLVYSIRSNLSDILDEFHINSIDSYNQFVKTQLIELARTEKIDIDLFTIWCIIHNIHDKFIDNDFVYRSLQYSKLHWQNHDDVKKKFKGFFLKEISSRIEQNIVD
jgi:hypothetical protein